MKFADQNGKEREVTLLWCGEEGYAAAYYADDSPKAKADLIGYLNNQIETDAEDAEMGLDHEEDENERGDDLLKGDE